MFALRYVLGIICLLILSATNAFSQSSNYPDKPVTIISDSSAGSSPDVVARFVAEGLSKTWGQQVVVVNKPGANGSIAAHAASEAVADGYTLFLGTLSTFVALPTIAPNIPVKLPRDFLPIGYCADQPMFIAVSPTLGVNTLPQLIERAKKEPGKISIAATGIGRLTHMTGELLQDRAGIKLLAVPYTHGPASAIGDIADGRVSMIVEGYSGIVGAVKAGQVKLIATGAPERLPEFPDVPAVSEILPGFIGLGWQVVVAPLGTPAPIIAKVNADMFKVLSDPEVKKKFASFGNYPRPMTVEQTLDFVNKQQETWQPIVQKIAAQGESK
ncbi:MAG TPA: tripartite tricarboxylate transporter substrate binding protein [Xanthobacteraceae bacterium]|jgi:tripartite-type tricarboxylate transporter receptor subunit TctC|nr:tripartite tricarboxylate transporter substrate binding protein [Xanthobacteraceae bacterium]